MKTDGKTMRIDLRTKQMIQLVARSVDSGDGWRECSSAIWELAKRTPDELIEKNEKTRSVRLTAAGQAICYWCL